MATTTAFCTSAKVEFMTATHDLTASTGSALKLALIKVAPAGTYGAASTNYTDITGNSDEVSGTGYTTTGPALTNITPVSSGTTALADFDDVTLSTASISATAGMIYNTSASGAAISTHDFSGTKTSSGGDFTLAFPAADASNAILRLA